MAEDTLELSTAHTRRKLDVDGKKYDILSMDEVPFEKGLQVESVFTKLPDFDEKSSPAEVKAFVDKLRAAVRIVVPDLPAETEVRLSDKQCIKILDRFLTPPGAPAPAAKAPPAEASC